MIAEVLFFCVDITFICHIDCHMVTISTFEGTEHHRKRECLKSAISKGKVYLPGCKKQ